MKFSFFNFLLSAIWSILFALFLFVDAFSLFIFNIISSTGVDPATNFWVNHVTVFLYISLIVFTINLIGLVRSSDKTAIYIFPLVLSSSTVLLDLFLVLIASYTISPSQ
ncbi:hypothetical protein [Halobacillus amylolyticus]|uniref:Uncharacterized protein n=1 Tax=Halobacillus amylolyticus TaxID=2932259 RepID=A0ABY4HEJ7_9BACI|nr:hypothetical protein [Halobacillus amylolyticus]UOR12838.1 hypothetical protein MUO15_04815 [Halobacillus amylolyticus]